MCIHNRLSQQLSKYPEVSRIDASTLTREEPLKRNHSQQLEADNEFTKVMENPNLTDNNRNIEHAVMLRTISRRTERMTQWKKGNKWPTIYRSAHYQEDKNKAEGVFIV